MIDDDFRGELEQRLREAQVRLQELAQNQPQREQRDRLLQDQARAQEAEIRAAEEQLKEIMRTQPQRAAEIMAQQQQLRAAQVRAGIAAVDAEYRAGKLIKDPAGKPFLTELAEAGYKDLPVETIVKLAQGGVTGSYMREMKEAGFGNLTIDEIVEAAQGGVSGKDMKAAREYNPKLTLKQIIALKQGGALE